MKIFNKVISKNYLPRECALYWNFKEYSSLFTSGAKKIKNNRDKRITLKNAVNPTFLLSQRYIRRLAPYSNEKAAKAGSRTPLEIIGVQVYRP